MDPLIAPFLGRPCGYRAACADRPKRRSPAPAHQPRRRCNCRPGPRCHAQREPATTRSISAARAGVTRSSASISKIHSPRQASDTGVAPRPFPLPGAFDEPIGEAPRDLARAVAAAVEHDDDLVGKAETGEAVGELALLRRGRPRPRTGEVPPHRSRRGARAPRPTSGGPRLPPYRPRDRPSRFRSCDGQSPGRTSSPAGSADRTWAARGPHGAYRSAGLGPNRPKRRGARRRGDMHQAGIVADEQGAAPQHRGGGRKIELADEIDPPVVGQRRRAAAPPAAAHDPPPAPRRGLPAASRRDRSAAAPARQSGSARHCLPRQLAAGPIASTGPPAGISAAAARSWHGAVHSRGAGGGSRPNRPPSWRTRCCRGSPFADHLACARAQQPGQSRAAQIDDHVPSPRCDRGIERQPVQSPSAACSTTRIRSSPGTA